MNLGAVLDRAMGFLPRLKLYAAIAGALVLSHGLAYCEGRKDGKASERAAQAIVEAKAAVKAREADAKAGAAVDASKADVEAGNQKARDAAAGSDDSERSIENTEFFRALSGKGIA
jgi:hypothetical protein